MSFDVRHDFILYHFSKLERSSEFLLFIPSRVRHQIPFHMASQKRKASTTIPASQPTRKKHKTANPHIPTLSSLDTLPTELFRIITSFLPNDALRNLALTSRHLRLHGNDALYHNLKLSTPVNNNARKLLNTPLTRVCLAELVRSLEIYVDECKVARKSKYEVQYDPPRCTSKSIMNKRDRATYRKRIHSYSETGEKCDLENVFAKVTCDARFSGLLFPLCPNLQNVEIRCRGTSWQHVLNPILDTSSLRILGIHDITNLTLHQDKVSLTDRTPFANTQIWPTLLALTRLPSLQSLSISGIEATQPPNLAVPRHHSPQNALKTLRLEDCVFRPEALKFLLEQTRCLEHLTISIPHHYARQYASEEAFTPWDDLTTALSPVQPTLRSFELDTSSIWWHYQLIHTRKHRIFPIASLSSCANLKTVKLPYHALFGDAESDVSVEDVACLLPDGLERIVLTISYYGSSMNDALRAYDGSILEEMLINAGICAKVLVC
ncbi:hypothetical protein P280DRAFT_542264 [Massarina eburnea CBS 473.64]|uniref:F-box domain-containing protein n=1 Tax=Massarina eburnea CBS 473.64 TaxID=1395130 RepID=A0A6A6RZZ3_9PLEO|nr:hypothetical protein P280DRAFT_542264 [Massarina eburnea CBS 473.64]